MAGENDNIPGLLLRVVNAIQVSNAGASSLNDDTDTDGNPVPTYKAHTYTYTDSGNLMTDTVTDGANTWVRTFGWMGGSQSSDSGWVKQNG